MARSSARRSPRQNPHDGEDELAGGTSTEGSDRRTPAPAASRTPTPTVASVVAPLATSGSADSSVVRYLEDDLQQILRTVLDFRPLAPVPAPVVAAAPHYKGPRERPLKARFPVKRTWSAIISSNSAKITSLLPVPRAQTEFCLRLSS